MCPPPNPVDQFICGSPAVSAMVRSQVLSPSALGVRGCVS
jgi:hypothetical protein